MPTTPLNVVDGSPIATFSGKSIKGLSQSDIKQTSVLVCLSIIGNSHCVGEDLSAIVKQSVNNHKQTTFLIGDETYWHNLQTDDNEDVPTLKKAAIDLGSNYLKDNLPAFLAILEQCIDNFKAADFYDNYKNESVSEQVSIINRLAKTNNIPFQIVRWNEWITNENHNFAAKQTKISELYDSVPTLKNSLDVSTNDFVRRHRHKQVDDEKLGLNQHEKQKKLAQLKKCAYNYLKEETPAIFLIAAELGFNYIAYPGKAVQLFHDTKDFFITTNTSPSAHPLGVVVENANIIANWLEIGFKKKPKSTPTKLTTDPLHAKLMLSKFSYFAPKHCVINGRVSRAKSCSAVEDNRSSPIPFPPYAHKAVRDGINTSTVVNVAYSPPDVVSRIEIELQVETMSEAQSKSLLLRVARLDPELMNKAMMSPSPTIG